MVVSPKGLRKSLTHVLPAELAPSVRKEILLEHHFGTRAALFSSDVAHFSEDRLLCR